MMPETGARADHLMIVSADSHVGLPVGDYAPYMDPRYRHLVDDLVREDADWWELVDFGVLVRFPDEDLELVDTRNAIRSGGVSGCWDPDRRLEEMDAEGIAAEVLNPAAQFVGMPWFGATVR